MYEFAPPIVFGLFIWWFSTGAVLYLVRIQGGGFSVMIAGATLVLAASVWGVAITSQLTTVGGAYFAFTCAILMWGWAEIIFLSGLLTGIRTEPCPPGCTGWRRAGYAICAILYHELILLALVGLIVIVSWNGINQVAATAFVILWTMRLSAKLNLFFGVPVLNDEFLPARLGHLKSFFVRGPINLLFPVIVTASTVMAAWLVEKSLSAPSAFERTQFVLLATLMGLAVLEHWFMVLPLPIKRLWEWGMRVGMQAKIGPPKAAQPFAANRHPCHEEPRSQTLNPPRCELELDGLDPLARPRPKDRIGTPDPYFDPIASEAAACLHPLLGTAWRHQ